MNVDRNSSTKSLMDNNSYTNAAVRLGAEIREVRKARGMTLNTLSAQLPC